MTTTTTTTSTTRTDITARAGDEVGPAPTPPASTSPATTTQEGKIDAGDDDEPALPEPITTAEPVEEGTPTGKKEATAPPQSDSIAAVGNEQETDASDDASSNTGVVGASVGVGLLILAAAIIVAAVVLRKKTDEKERGEKALPFTGSDLDMMKQGSTEPEAETDAAYATPVEEFRLNVGRNSGGSMGVDYEYQDALAAGSGGDETYDVIGAGAAARCNTYETSSSGLMNFAASGGSVEALSQALHDMGSNSNTAGCEQPVCSIGAAEATHDTAASTTATVTGTPVAYDTASNMAGGVALAVYALGNAVEDQGLHNTADGLCSMADSTTTTTTSTTTATTAAADPYPLFQSARPTAFGEFGSKSIDAAEVATYDLAATKELMPAFDESAIAMMDKLVGVPVDSDAHSIGSLDQPACCSSEDEDTFVTQAFRLDDGNESVRLTSVRRANPLYSNDTQASTTSSRTETC